MNFDFEIMRVDCKTRFELHIESALNEGNF